MRLALIGNCQVQTYAVMAARMIENADIRVFDYSQPYSRDEEARLRFARDCESCDHILAQTALLSHTNETALRERCGDRLVTIANFYFRGLFPDSCYVGGFGHRHEVPSLVNSIVILDAFLRGLSEQQALDSFDLDTFERLGLLDAWESSMQEMHRREAGRSVDVPGAALMEAACRAYPAFLTINHPSAALLTEYLSRVLRHIDVRHAFFNPLTIADPLAVHDTTPVLDIVAEHYRLPYRTSQRWKINALEQRHVGLVEVIGAFYASYRSVDPQTLIVHSPTDLLPRLQADPGLAHLIDPAAAPPSSVPPAPPQGPQSELIRHEVRRAMSSLRTDMHELSTYMHKVHSFLEVMDPKVERLVHTCLEIIDPRVEGVARSLAELQKRRETPDVATAPPAPPPSRRVLPRAMAAVAAAARACASVLRDRRSRPAGTPPRGGPGRRRDGAGPA